MTDGGPAPDAASAARGLVLRLIRPTVITGAGIAIAATGLTAEYVNAAGESHPIEVQPAAGEADSSDTDSSDGHSTHSAHFGAESTTVSHGGDVSTGLHTTIGPAEPGGTDAPNIFQNSQQAPDLAALGHDVLVDFDQHITVHELPNGQFSVESTITIHVYHDGEVQTFTEHESQTVSHDPHTDLVISQDGDVVIHLDDEGHVQVDIQGDLTVTEAPSDPHDHVPDGAVVVVQDQDLTVIDGDDGHGDDTEDPHVHGHFNETADTTDNPADGSDHVLIDQSETRTESHVDTQPHESWAPRPVYQPTYQAPYQTTPAYQTASPPVLVQATVQSTVLPTGADPAFGSTTSLLPDPTGVLDTQVPPVERPVLDHPQGTDTPATTDTDGHFDPPQDAAPEDQQTDLAHPTDIGEQPSTVDSTSTTPDGTDDFGAHDGTHFDPHHPSGMDTHDPLDSTSDTAEHDQPHEHPLDAAHP